MVLKASKGGVRSGNTLKASNSRFLRQYRLHSCIRRELIRNDGDIDETFSDSLGETSNVQNDYTEFSLNKKGRWTLPDQLRNDILHGCFKHERYGVQLIEGHKLMKKASCIRFASSFGKVRQLCINKRKNKQKRRGYFKVSSILNEKPANTSRRRHRNRRRHGTDVATNEAAEQPIEQYTPPELRYEVLYPSPITSSITHNPKYVDPTYGDSGTSSRRTKERKRRSKLVHFIQEDLDNMCSDYDDSEEEDPVSYPDLPERETSATLEAILKQASKAQSLVSGCGRRSSNEYDAKRKEARLVYIDRDQGEAADQAETSHKAANQTFSPNSNTSLTLAPVLVIIPTEEVDEWVLKHKFGDKYLECECFPRKCVIDISTEVSKFDNLTFACLVLVHDIDNEINNAKEDVYKIYLNIRLGDGINCVKIETLFDYMVTNIDEIIQKSLFFVETLPEDVFMKEKKQHTPSKVPSKTTLQNCARWESRAYRMDTKYLLETCFQNNQKHQDALTLGYEVVSQMDAFSSEPLDISTPTDKFCSVCFESVGGMVSATALMSCGHWFCDSCWKEHLITGIKEGKTALMCPEYDCDKNVDMGTLISLVDINYIVRFLRRCHDTEVEQQSVTKWCPNPVCGAVVKIPSSEVKTVTCRCGRKMCFDCLGEMHWPAPCDAASSYRKKLVENGDDTLMPFEDIQTVEIRGKPCPCCNRFVEKNGGCPFMYCVCRKSFCWGCGKEWASATHGPDCYKHGYSNTYQTTKETIEPDDYLNSKLKGRKDGKWYKIALGHRVQQHQVKLRKLRAPMRELTKTLQHYVGRMERRNEPVSFDFDEPNEHYSCEAAKTRDFLKNMLELYVELQQTAEHVAVYLETKQHARDNLLPVKHISNRMTALSVFIYDLLQNGSTTDQKRVFIRLKETRFHARKCISGLVKCINRIET